MKHLLDIEGRLALETALLSDTLLAFDFDGTLAPIVDQPQDARVPALAALCLSQIARLCPVAIITGRSADDVAHRLGFAPQFIVGNHGAQMAGEERVNSEVLDEARAHLLRHCDALADAGVTLEDKGLSLALHYRLAGDHLEAARRIDDMLHGVGPGIRRFGGKRVVNVVAAQAPDKADALECLVAQAGAQTAVFVGDDVNDEPVYERAPPPWVTVRVGLENADTRARFFLDSQQEIEPMLRTMLAILQWRKTRDAGR
jgi:trehalose 6-phosphate phosphatase